MKLTPHLTNRRWPMGATIFAIVFCAILAFGIYLMIQIVTITLQCLSESHQRVKREKRMRFWISKAHDIFRDHFIPCPGCIYTNHPRYNDIVEIQTTAVIPLEHLKDNVICLRVCQLVSPKFRRTGRGSYLTSDYFYSVELYDSHVLEWDGQFATAPDRGDTIRDQVVRSLGIPNSYL